MIRHQTIGSVDRRVSDGQTLCFVRRQPERPPDDEVRDGVGERRLARGETLGDGRYVIERELGSGAVATMYLARDVRHERLVAVKMLRREIAASVGAAGFLREMRIAAALHHPHIVPLFDSGEESGLPYYVMPRVEGESLRARLDREGTIPVRDAVRIARELAGALAHAHQHGIVHRDIRPENVLLTGDPSAQEWHALVTDFGIARAAVPLGTAEARLTPSGAVGSPPYVSPEHAADGVTLDARSDVHGLGCVLYEMLAGRAPFTGDSMWAAMARPRGSSLRRVRPSVPAWLERVVGIALAGAPNERFATAEAFLAALEERRGATASPRRASLVRPAPAAWHAGMVASGFRAAARWVRT